MSNRLDWKVLTKEQRIEALAALLAEHTLSASMLCERFDNCSRNAIIGMVARNPDRLKLTYAQGPRVMNAARKRKAVAAPNVESIPFLKIRDGACKWPLWNDLPADASSAPCCGAPSAESKPWCEFHQGRAVRVVA